MGLVNSGLRWPIIGHPVISYPYSKGFDDEKRVLGEALQGLKGHMHNAMQGYN